jgi:hypothetical protein
MSYLYDSNYLKATRNNPDPALSSTSADPNLRLPKNPRQLVKHKKKTNTKLVLTCVTV